MSHRDSSRRVDADSAFSDVGGEHSAPKKTGLKKLWSDFKSGVEIRWSNFTTRTPFGSKLNKELQSIRAPLGCMYQDFINTFKPYTQSRKAPSPLKQDAKQIVYGLKNTVSALIYIVITPFKSLWSMVKGFKQGFMPGLKNAGIELGLFIPKLLDGVAHLVRGATQIAAYPLTLVLKMPLRVILTIRAGRKEKRSKYVVDVGSDSDSRQKPAASFRRGQAPVRSAFDSEEASRLHIGRDSTQSILRSAQQGQPSQGYHCDQYAGSDLSTSMQGFAQRFDDQSAYWAQTTHFAQDASSQSFDPSTTSRQPGFVPGFDYQSQRSALGLGAQRVQMPPARPENPFDDSRVTARSAQPRFKPTGGEG